MAFAILVIERTLHSLGQFLVQVFNESFFNMLKDIRTTILSGEDLNIELIDDEFEISSGVM